MKKTIRYFLCLKYKVDHQNSQAATIKDLILIVNLNPGFITILYVQNFKLIWFICLCMYHNCLIVKLRTVDIQTVCLSSYNWSYNIFNLSIDSFLFLIYIRQAIHSARMPWRQDSFRKILELHLSTENVTHNLTSHTTTFLGFFSKLTSTCYYGFRRNLLIYSKSVNYTFNRTSFNLQSTVPSWRCQKQWFLDKQPFNKVKRGWN